ncbi:MAG: NUDIX domain-containing protein [Clostridia bacterium]|nr:NUDIX domain-containing protein [Clostridia bacterium]
MAELWDIYDINKMKTGRTAERDVYELKEGEYHLIVTGIIMNSKNEILISKRAPHKKFGLMWECNCGSVLAGETSLEGIIRELREELGIEFSKKEAIFLKEVRRDEVPPDFKDLWLFRRDIDINDITFPDGESIEAKWVDIEEFMRMYENREIIPTVDFGMEEYQQALESKGDVDIG